MHTPLIMALTLAFFKQKLLSNAKSTPEAVDVSIFVINRVSYCISRFQNEFSSTLVIT